VKDGSETPRTFAASAIALSQDCSLRFSVIVIFFLGCVFGKLHVFDRAFDQEFVFIGSALE
jgi:hypothetical protein